MTGVQTCALPIWNKEIRLGKEGDVIIIGYYRRLGNEVLNGRKCVVIETEIGQKEKGTDAERGVWKTHSGTSDSIKVKAKTWFEPESGRILKMETHKEYGGTIYDVTYELLTEDEIRKIDGIEDDWELVLPGVNKFQLTADGKIVFTRVEEVGGEVKSQKSKVKSNESAEADENLNTRTTDNGSRKTSFIYICNGDGSNQRRLTEGTNPVVSPDGKWVAYGKNVNELWIIEIEGKKEDRKIGENVLIAPAYRISWSKDNKKIGFNILEEGERKFGIFELKTNKNMKLDLNISQISWLSDNNYFIYGSEKYFLYDLKENESKELEEFPKRNLTKVGKWSPKDLIYMAEKNNRNVVLLYFSPKFEIVKEELIDNPSFFNWNNWSKNGKFIIAVDANKIHLYSLQDNKTIWISPTFNFNFPEISKDLKWLYFIKGGMLTRRQNIYRIPAPKKISKIVEGN